MIFALDCTVDICGDVGYDSPTLFGVLAIVALIVVGLIIHTWEKDHPKKS